MEKTKKKEKKKFSAFSFFSGLILLIIAVGLVLMKNGVNLFGKGTTPDQVFMKAHLGVCDKINEELLEYLSYCGENARENDGHLKDETLISSKKELQVDDSSLIGSLISIIGLGKVSVTEGYSLKNEDGLITVVRDSDKKTVYSKETILYGMDFSKLGKSSALKERTIKKLLTHYEEVFIKALRDDGYDYKRDVLVNIDNVIQVESSFSFDYSNEDICKALEAVLDNIANDKKWKKAYASMQSGDFTEYIEEVKKRVTGPDSILSDIYSIKGTIYVRSDGKLNYAELTFDVDDKDIEARLTKDASWLIKNAVDVDPVFTVSVGYTTQGDTRGFKFGIVNGDNVVRTDITGHGTVNTTGIIKTTAVDFTGTADMIYKGKKGSLVLKEAQLVDMKKGFRVVGNFALNLDQVGLFVNTWGSNSEQSCMYDVSLAGKTYMTGELIFKDK